jgi:hypothetical protein
MEKSSYVVCPICQKQLASLSSKHLKTHNTNVKDLRVLYPNVKIHSDEFLERKKVLDDKYRKNNKEKLDEYFKKYRDENAIKRNEYQKQYRQNNLEIVREKDKAYALFNKEEKKKYDKEYRLKNKVKIAEQQKKYREKNKDKIKTSKNEYCIKNKHVIIWRRVLNNSLRDLGKRKKGKTIDLLGYSAIQLKEHLESLFTDGMTWDNYGEWHVDHIKQIISFDKNTHTSIVNALSNLRPMWATTREINGVVYEGNLNRNKYNERKNTNGD